MISKLKQSRYGFVAFCFVTLLILWSALRLTLFLKFGPAGVSTWDRLLAFPVGLHRDALAALFFMLPLLVWFFIVSNRVFASRVHRVFFAGACFIWALVQIFLLMVEFYFFDEFMSRFNTVAVDYLFYPHEVFINIWDSYPVAKVLAVCAVLAAVWTWLAMRLFRSMWNRPHPVGIRFLWFAGALVLAVVMSHTVTLRGPEFSRDRTLNQIADNGALSFASAAWTHNLDYAAFYKTMNLDEAYQRVHRLLASPNAEFVGDAHSIRRKIAGDPNRPRLNVVIMLEESLGSEFWASLGRKGKPLTPEMDKQATGEGILFDNIYASGNRTVRGFEGVLSSFPPLPGDSIVKRSLSDNVETVARVLKRDGYNTVFLYGGRGIFDSMRPYAVENGWDKFVEQKDFDHPTFATIWGVCDEDLFARAIQEFRELDKKGKPFLGTIMSVSNHKPYTYPPGRIPEDPNKRTRENAVKYSDWCLGQFFKAAKQEPFWTNTVFVVVADHGDRVYGSQSIPIYSYEIPLVILGPAVVIAPQRISTLGCSLDVSPTVLGLIGRPYESLFFGRDLFHDPLDEDRVLINHNRDIGMFTHDRLVVLGLKQTVEFYQGDPKVAEITPMTSPTPLELELEKDTVALYQVADDLYMHKRYRIDPDPGKH